MVSPDPQREWRTLGEEPFVRTPWFQVDLADVELPDGRRIDHYLFRVPPVVLTAMQDEHGRVLLILRYRFIPGTWGWELPSGLADPAEDFAAAAAREISRKRAGNRKARSFCCGLKSPPGSPIRSTMCTAVPAPDGGASLASRPCAWSGFRLATCPR